MHPTLSHIFTTHSEKFLTSKKVMDLLYKERGYDVCDREFQEMFLQFRDSFEYNGKKVLHFKDMGKHFYCLSDNKYLIIKHNALLNKEQRLREKRKIQMI